jgi:UDP-2-acetamido-3-amino-2,3-dideoxy-glucuronate N-acetyltransferase
VFCNDVWPTTSKDGFDIAALISGEITTVRVEQGASVGAGAIILPGVIIGYQAAVAAGAIVRFNVPALHIYLRDDRIMPINGPVMSKRMRAV